MDATSLYGALIGSAVGDSFGLKYEGLSRKRIHTLYPQITKQSLCFGYGLISDDTEHLLFTSKCLCESGGEEQKFEALLAKSIRNWFLTLPYGIGLATLRSCLKLLFGFSSAKSGVYSAGNGPAMRSGIIGICYGSDIEKMKRLVQRSTRITHTDQKAEIGALIIAYSAYISSTHKSISSVIFFQNLAHILSSYHDPLIQTLLQNVAQSVASGESLADFCKREFHNDGISGYIYQTVPAVLHCWLRHQEDYEAGILEIIRCGGDTDTTGAILGLLIGVKGNLQGIPSHWQKKIILYPFDDAYLQHIASSLKKMLGGNTVSIRKINHFCILLRNLLAYPLILFYGLRRFFPPYG